MEWWLKEKKWYSCAINHSNVCCKMLLLKVAETSIRAYVLAIRDSNRLLINFKKNLACE